MAYVKTTWVNKKTKLNATNMNNIEQGISEKLNTVKLNGELKEPVTDSQTDTRYVDLGYLATLESVTELASKIEDITASLANIDDRLKKLEWTSILIKDFAVDPNLIETEGQETYCFTWDYSKEISEQSDDIKTAKLLLNGTVVKEKLSAKEIYNKQCTFVTELTADASWSLVITDKYDNVDIATTKTTVILDRAYWGVTTKPASDDRYNADFIRGLEKSGAVPDPGGARTITCNISKYPEDKYFYYCIPSNFEIESIVGGRPKETVDEEIMWPLVIKTVKENVLLGNKGYNIWLFNQTGIGETKIKITEAKI